MINIISLGTPACNIARQLEKYKQYKVFKIDDEITKEKNYFKVDKLSRPEDYEDQKFKLPSFLKSLSGETLFIVCGSSSVSAASLRILEQISKKCKIKIMYIKPNRLLISAASSTQEVVIRGVLQEYTRSGVFEKIFLICNSKMEDLIGPTTVYETNDKINEMISYNYHMLNSLERSKPVLSTFSELSTISRIATLGVFDCSSAETFLFFPLDMPREMRYYYAIPTKQLETEKNLVKNRTSAIGDTAVTTNASYGFFETGLEEQYGVVTLYSSKIQN